MPDLPFDTWRDVAEIQTRALAAAASVVERMIGQTNGQANSTNGTGNGSKPGGRRELRALRAEAERLTDAYMDSARLLLDRLFDFLDDSPSQSDLLTVGPIAPGASASTEVFFHVLDGPCAARASLHATALTSHDGFSVAGDRVAFTPGCLETTAPRSTHEVRVTVSVPAATPANTYHGFILAAGLPEVALPVRLIVGS